MGGGDYIYSEQQLEGLWGVGWGGGGLHRFRTTVGRPLGGGGGDYIDSEQQ